jgi:hypothetical protein
MLITNTVWHGGLPLNGDISAGQYRPLDLLADPFKVSNARIVFEYFATRLDYKRILLVNGPPSLEISIPNFTARPLPPPILSSI